MGDLYLRQLKLGPMDNFVYLVGPAEGEEAVVIDAAWDVDAILAAAEQDGRRISAAVVSHCHADHTNGLAPLLAHRDIPVYAQQAELDFSAALRGLGDCLRPLGPGDPIPVGTLTLQALHTPGHTPGSQCILAEGALVSGDTVFIKACGRCDLAGGDPAAMYRTITQVLMKLPDPTRLYPGHDYAAVPVSTLAAEKAENPYFRFADLASFVGYRMRPRT